MNTVIKIVRERTLQIFSILILVYLMLPLAVIILLSFNKPKGRQNTSWNEFSLDAWTNICRDQTICRSFSTSIQIGLLVTIIS
ncbi:MAG: ABC transporter permease, partial [Actinomycetes bacterium]